MRHEPSPPAAVDEPTDTFHEVIETLATIERPPCSDGERAAARWIAERLEAAGCDEVVSDEEPARGTFPPTITGVGLAGMVGAYLVARGRKGAGGVLATVALATLIDEIQNGPRVARRFLRRERSTVNVIGRVGDRDAPRTLVVLAHHDAAQTGIVFDQSWAKALHARRPDVMKAATKQVPQWWLGLAPGVMTLASLLTKKRRLARTAVGVAGLGTVLIADILRSPTVPGANDNLSGVAVLVGLAEALAVEPISGLRVLLVSAGAEEALQEGIRAFMERHRGDLPHGRTWFLNLDTVGSPELVMLEGEGPVWMEDYADASFRDVVAQCAADANVRLERGLRARASTDAIIPSRRGYPTASVVSLMPWRLPGNYHLMSDVPANIDYDSVADATRLAYSVARRIAPDPN